MSKALLATGSKSQYENVSNIGSTSNCDVWWQNCKRLMIIDTNTAAESMEDR